MLDIHVFSRERTQSHIDCVETSHVISLILNWGSLNCYYVLLIILQINLISFIS
jgi:hypothetical protein